jgi:4-azaleucine resistance transporter AzlC
MNDHPFRDGTKAALPIVLGYIPVGIAFGLLARRAGLTPLEATSMSFFVYAGASQFIAVEMISKGAIWFPIILTTFFINLRHLLMSSSLSLFFNRNSSRTLGLLSAQLTDESFAVAMSDTSKILNRPRYVFGLQVTSHLAWISGSLGGALFGILIDPKGYGFPFALPSLFICLLVLQIKSSDHLWMMVVAGISAILFKRTFPGNWYILLAAFVGTGIGVIMKPKTESSKIKGQR